MKFIQTMKFAYSNLLLNKTRSFLTMLGIIIGVGSIITIMSVGSGAQNFIFSQVESLGTNTIGIIPGGGDEMGPPAAVFGVEITTLTYKDLKEIKKIPHLAFATPYANGSAAISYKNKTRSATFSGVSSEYIKVEDTDVSIGRFILPEENDSVSKIAVLGSNINKKLFFEENPIGKKIRINKENFTVVGVMKERGASFLSNDDNQIFVPIKTAQKILLGINHISLIRGKVDKKENIPIVISEIKSLLNQRHKIKDPNKADFTVRSADQALSIIGNITGALNLFLGTITAISLIVGGIGIMNIMLVNVAERTREIGLRKAVGANKTNIMSQFLLESVFLTFIGGLIGVVFGCALSLLIAIAIGQFGLHWNLVISTFSIVISISTSVFIGIIFGIYPAYKSANMDPIEALRYE